jgi:tetratricopeptide (TPR) repeat protein
VEIPGTLHALLTARLDRLEPTPRRLLERAAVEGRRFRVAAILALSPEIPPVDVERAMASLERTGLVQSEDEAAGRWRFSHPLVLEVAYRGLSKASRADLHERLADWLATHDADQPDADERVARHLERALHLTEELGRRDDRSAALASRAGALFAASGLRAFAALDLATTCDLLGRASLLLPEQDPRRLDLLPNLGVALMETGRPEETEALLTKAIVQSRAAGSERDAMRATIQLMSNRIFRSSTGSEIDDAVERATAAAGELEAMHDEVGLAEAAITIEYLEFMRGRTARSQEWVLRALRHGLASGRLRESSQASADLVGSSVFGPRPFGTFVALADEVLPLPGPIAACAGHALSAIAALAAGAEAGFEEHERRWHDVLDRNGLGWLGAAQGLVIANVEIRVGRAGRAEDRLREAREVMEALGDIWWISTLDWVLAGALFAQGRSQDFLRLADAIGAPPVSDPGNMIQRQVIGSRAMLIRGSAVDAEAAARRAVELASPTDLTLDRADALGALGDALDARGMTADAAAARVDAAERLRAKGLLVPD